MRGVTIPMFGLRYVDTDDGGLRIEHLTEADLKSGDNDPDFARRCQAVLAMINQHPEGIGGRAFDDGLKLVRVRASEGRAAALHLARTGHVTMTTAGGRKYGPIDGKATYVASPSRPSVEDVGPGTNSFRLVDDAFGMDFGV